ncbi:MAG: cellulase family glycosylhydrolase [Anaerolineae bacterium]
MLHIDGPWIKDQHGRTLLLRGVNLGGSSKVPTRPNGATHLREGFFNHRDVSFVGRPFPLEEAREHFTRLREWGLTFLRFLVTWEAVEHAGPGIYDEAYLDYLVEVVRLAGEHGLTLFIDPHQDVWSRFTGGDGAPGWTLEAVGFEMTHFKQTGAAIVHATHGDPFPRMVWTTNWTKLAGATMFTLFFAGNDFAPQTCIEGEPAQEYLQRHYINAIRQVALRLKDFDHVVGFDTMNEPSVGFIGWEDLTRTGGRVKMGEMPSPLQAMALGSGIPQEVEFWEIGLAGARLTGTRRIDPGGVTAWQAGVTPIWQQHGVWKVGEDGQPVLLQPDYFTRVNSRRVDFAEMYFKPFALRYTQAIREIDPDAIIFIESDTAHPPPSWGPADPPRVVHAPHWYDGAVLFMNDFSPVLAADSRTSGPIIGLPRRIHASFVEQIGDHVRDSQRLMGGVPTLIGETGIAYGLRGKKAYRTGDFSLQVRALDRTMRALEANLVHVTLWNYTSDNTNERGDGWNGEDLSVFSRDQQTNPADINSGGRALQALLRPYPRATAGQPLRLSFNVRRRVFEYEFQHDDAAVAPTEIFVPRFQYPGGFRVEVSDGSYEIDPDRQLLTYHHTGGRRQHLIRIRPR